MRATTIREFINSPVSLTRLTDGSELKGWLESIDLPNCAIRIRTKLELKSGERFQVTIKGTRERCEFLGRLLVNQSLDDGKHSVYANVDGKLTLTTSERVFEFVQDGVVVFGRSREDPRKALHEHFATFEFGGARYEAALAEVGLDCAVLLVPGNLNAGDNFNLQIIMNRKVEEFRVVVTAVDPDQDFNGLFRVVVQNQNPNRLEAAAWRRLLDLAVA